MIVADPELVTDLRKFFGVSHPRRAPAFSLLHWMPPLAGLLIVSGTASPPCFWPFRGRFVASWDADAGQMIRHRQGGRLGAMLKGFLDRNGISLDSARWAAPSGP